VAAGVLFVLPGMIVLGILSWVYVRYQNASFIAATFFGLKAAMLAIVIEAVVRIGRRALKSRFHLVLAGASFLAIYAFGVPFPWLVLAAAVIGLAFGRSANATASSPSTATEANDYVIDRMVENGLAHHLAPKWKPAVRTTVACLVLWVGPLIAASLWLGSDHIVTREGWFFSQAAVVTFDGAYAVLAYVAQHAVDDLGWLRPGEMVDGLALAETTPGPLIMVLQFVGFVAAHRLPGSLDPWLAACLGALMTTWVTFVPSFLFVLVGAPFVESISRAPTLRAALSAITAAVVGVVLNLSVWFALHKIFRHTAIRSIGIARFEVPVWSSVNALALLIAAAALLATLRFKVPLGWLLLGSLLAGWAAWTWR
jgi:chromate transporter